MKKNRLLAAVLSSVLVLGSASIPVMADAMKVVTLGADLTEAQRQTMMNYFRANANEVQILYITNQDERNHLGSYIPLEQIGTRTLSCAYVKPTTSGGIRVRTANLTYVTGNMIASTLSTSGVTNCEVIAACPFEVSGTGALTGIQMAYEQATGYQLDSAKKDLAAQEIVVTGNVANQVGNNDATKLINNAKMEVIQNEIHNTEEIYNIVNNICIENNINATQSEIIQVVNLLTEISEQNYAYEDVAETLENVEENVSQVKEFAGEGEEEVEQAAAAMETEYDEDSILLNIDEQELGEDIPTSSTDDPTLEYKTYDAAVELGEAAAETGEEEGYSESGIPEAEETVVNPEGNEEPEQVWEENGQETDIYKEGDFEQTEMIPEAEESSEADSSMTTEESSEAGSSMTSEERQEKMNLLDAEKAALYNAVLDFCRQNFENAEAAFTGEGTGTVTFTDPAVAVKLSQAISDEYLKIIAGETDPSLPSAVDSYVPDGTEKYLSTELNIMDRFLKELFGIDPMAPEAGNDILKDLSAEEKKLLYDGCINFFMQLYGESQEAPVPAAEEQPAPVKEASSEQYSTEVPSTGDEAQYSEGQGYQEESNYEGEYPEESGYGEEYYGEDYSYGIPEGTEEYY